jgi:hypothetical protein
MNPDENLRHNLSAWKVEVELPTQFQRGVWQRISAQESARSHSFWKRFSEWLAFEFCKPSHAALLLAASLTLSAGTGYLRAQHSNNRNWRQLETRYLDSINPLAHDASAI